MSLSGEVEPISQNSPQHVMPCLTAVATLRLLSILFLPSAVIGPESEQERRIPVLRLPPADVVGSHEFSAVSAMRELKNSQVLVIDRYSHEQSVVLVDFEQRTSRNLGRRGGGPGEYQGPLSIVPVGGDSSIISDGTLGRWLILAGSSIVGTVGPDRIPVSSLGTVLYGGDGQGRILGYRGFRIGRPSLSTYTFADSALAIMGQVTGKWVDTVLRLRAAGARMQRVKLVTSDGQLRPDHTMANPLLVPDQVMLFPDGWIAVAHVSPYQVDWRDPGGRWIRGSPLPFAASEVTERDRRAAMNRSFAPLDTRETPTSALADWPAILPPFVGDALLPLPSGHLIIRRTPVGSERVTRYDIVDRRGRLVATMELSPNQSLAGVGLRGAYVATIDAEGITRLSRHPTPAIP